MRTHLLIQQLGENIPFQLDQVPDTCPMCHCRIDTLFHNYYEENEPTNYRLYIICQCPSRDCREYFIARYKRHPVAHVMGGQVGSDTYELIDLSPRYFFSKQFDNDIIELSPKFIAIYHQAQEAEHHGLSEICGPGYRKALEFLIKDYLISCNLELTDDIEKKFLGNCIRDHISDPRIKTVAERAVWLGNDETHYQRKWNDKDITDLKVLTELTVHWISSEILTNKYMQSMS